MIKYIYYFTVLLITSFIFLINPGIAFAQTLSLTPTSASCTSPPTPVNFTASGLDSALSYNVRIICSPTSASCGGESHELASSITGQAQYSFSSFFNINGVCSNPGPNAITTAEGTYQTFLYWTDAVGTDRAVMGPELTLNPTGPSFCTLTPNLPIFSGEDGFVLLENGNFNTRYTVNLPSGCTGDATAFTTNIGEVLIRINCASAGTHTLSVTSQATSNPRNCSVGVTVTQSAATPTPPPASTPPPPSAPNVISPPVPGSPRPLPYIGCDDTDSPEFHSLRPYQASPCNQAAENLALFCGNDFTIIDQININMEFTDGSMLLGVDWRWMFEGQEIFPNDEQPNNIYFACTYCANNDCIPRDVPCADIGCQSDADCTTECRDNGDGTQTCTFTIDRIKDIAIDLEGAYLPIMGFTEPSEGATSRPQRVINSVFQSETLNNPDKVNEYVSWYLNGINNRAEYNPPNQNTEEGHRKIVDFSGPVKKLMAFESQVVDRIQEVQNEEVGGIRHDQIIGCRAGGNPLRCYPGAAIRVGLSYWENRFPPLRAAYETLNEYIAAFGDWRNRTYWRLYSYIPFSSTEDRIGIVELASYTVHPPISGTVVILSSEILSQDPAELYFPHMQEGWELSNIPRQIFNPQGAGD